MAPNLRGPMEHRGLGDGRGGSPAPWRRRVWEEGEDTGLQAGPRAQLQSPEVHLRRSRKGHSETRRTGAAGQTGGSLCLAAGPGVAHRCLVPPGASLGDVTSEETESCLPGGPRAGRAMTMPPPPDPQPVSDLVPGHASRHTLTQPHSVSVKLDPPSDLQSNVTSHYCVLTWRISPALEPLTAILSYELAFKKQEEGWEQAQLRNHIVGVTRLSLDAVELDPGSHYEARLRVRMATPETDVEEELRYEGQWSEWSRSARFPSPPRPDRGPLSSSRGQPGSSTLVAVPVFLLLTSLIYLVFKLSPRVKRSLSWNVPSPAAFFQSLYSVHHGDFQTWTGARRSGVLPSQDSGCSPRGASESGVHEDIAWLTYDPVDPWQSVILEEEQEGPGAGLLEAALLARPVVQGGQPPAYLPQKDWAPTCPLRPASPPSEGGSRDYWTLGCSGGCHTPTFPGNSPSTGPSPALAGGPSCDQQSLDAQPGSSTVGAGHGQWQDPAAQGV
ncbi:interleukin-9 receptor isoform X1 [Mustela erminea]|uniref:interleukin-9 receptor isoform X1 n=1 Tax=Mustela erminea TaxID=36723 RepID=UPI00138669DA|nr:interleukin-9 receptor isoform X1 [Mustela erminea]